jgi:hypothetical protein
MSGFIHKMAKALLLFIYFVQIFTLSMMDL